MALDDIKVFDRPPIDVFTDEILIPETTCGLDSNETLSIVIGSLSNAPVYDIPVNYSINGAAAVTETLYRYPSTRCYEQRIPSQQLLIYPFLVYTTLPLGPRLGTDGDLSNDTVSIDISNVAPISTFPFYRRF